MFRILFSSLLLWSLLSVAVAERFDVQSVFDLTESEWGEFETIPEAVPEPLHYPREPLLRVLNRVGQRLVESLLWDQSIGDPNLLDTLKQGDAVYFSQNVEVMSVQRVNFTPLRNIAENRPELDHFYISRVKIANRFDAICISLQVPREWNVTDTDNFSPLDPPKRSGFLGILLSSGKTPVFVASRLEWFPPTLLGKYGMDVALLEAVAPIPPTGITRENRLNLRLTEADQKPFYSLLATVTKIPGQEIDRNMPSEKFSVVELFNRPQFQQGRLIRLVGYARRIERITIDDPEVTARFGMDHYYQIALFTEDSQGNPLFFCIPEIPDGMPLGEAEGFPVSLSISGFFYKTWAYQKIGSGYPVEEGEKKSLTQLAPLFIGAKIDWFQPQEKPGSSSPHSLMPLYSSTLMFFGLALLWIFLRLSRKRLQPVRFQVKSDQRKR